mgnify:CR=1 FL=1
MFDIFTKEGLISFLYTLPALLFCLAIHEFAHAYTAYKLGDRSQKAMGRLTLNPLDHIDYMGAIFMLLFGFGWAKPVPVDDRKFKNPKVGMALTALAGPVANILAAMVGGFILCAVIEFSPQFIFSKFGYYTVLMLQFYISVNCSLAVFNLLPIPPLDGSKILFVFLPDKWIYKFYQYEQYIYFGLMALLLFTNVLDVPLNFLFGKVYNFVMTICSYPFELLA